MMNKRITKTITCLGLLMFFLIAVPILMVQATQAKRLVIIDAAHGGADAGVMVTDKIQEKEVTLILAQWLQKELAKSPDIQTQMTRTSDKTISNAERTKMVKAASGEVLFISLHVNAGFGKQAAGYEIYFPGFKTPATDQNESKAILKDMAQNKYLNDSVRLAQMIQRNMENVFPRKGRGLRDAPMPILGDLSIPAVVLEVGFATNTDDRKKILNEKTQQAIAQALAKGIRDYF
ncbi:MAG: N-acetylmuramoyl-L-alanine amidase [Deltaproteobacteria bacterium]|nr:N-acetylmuramoyl-L-alanine amidase [Deltaproteobacteria bacterium]